jgi:hypothetical protein
MQTRTRRAISDAERKAIFAAWNNVCAYCENNPAQVVDHIVPFAKGGACELENFAACCTRCNARKTDNELGEGYLQIILAIAKNRAPKIRESIVRAQKPKATKSAKVQRAISNDQDYIKSSTYGDWSDMHTEILSHLNRDSDAIYTFKIDKEELLNPLYVFNMSIKTGNRRFNPLLEISYCDQTKEAELQIRAEAIPYLQICAEKRIKAGETILL